MFTGASEEHVADEVDDRPLRNPLGQPDEQLDDVDAEDDVVDRVEQGFATARDVRVGPLPQHDRVEDGDRDDCQLEGAVVDQGATAVRIELDDDCRFGTCSGGGAPTSSGDVTATLCR